MLLWRQEALQFTEKCRCRHASSLLLDLPIRHVMASRITCRTLLPELSGGGESGVARCSSGRTAAGSLLPRHLHPAIAGGRDRFPEQQTVYGLLMRAAAQPLMTLVAERLGAKIGLIAVLHSWGQTLTHHPHVHCLVPGGGVALDGQRWVVCKSNFLLSIRVLSKTFRCLFLDGLETAFRRGKLGFFGDLAPLAKAATFAERVRPLRHSAFVVYAKPPFGGPERVLAYIVRYTHRTAIANSRLVAVDNDPVAFSYKDYRRGGVMRLVSCTSSSAAFSSTSCPAASTASVTMASSPRATEVRPSRACAICFRSSPPASPQPHASHTQTNTPASCSHSARIAALSCAASASSPNPRPPPSAATHHDIKSRTDLDRLLPSRRAAGADAPCHRGSLPPRFSRGLITAPPNGGPSPRRGAFEPPGECDELGA